VRTDIEELAMGTWEPGDDELLPWMPGDGFPDGNDPLRQGAALYALDGEDDEAPSPFWEDPPRSGGR
jgi:hypothetical protein